eukprot:2984531-Prymnesium_polylepis.1
MRSARVAPPVSSKRPAPRCRRRRMPKLTHAPLCSSESMYSSNVRHDSFERPRRGYLSTASSASRMSSRTAWQHRQLAALRAATPVSDSAVPCSLKKCGASACSTCVELRRIAGGRRRSGDDALGDAGGGAMAVPCSSHIERSWKDDERITSDA